MNEISQQIQRQAVRLRGVMARAEDAERGLIVARAALYKIAEFSPECTHGWAESMRHIARKALQDTAK